MDDSELTRMFEDIDNEYVEEEVQPLAPNVVKIINLNDDFVSGIIDLMQQDEHLPRHKKNCLENITVQQLTLFLRPLETIVGKHVFSAAAREKAWSQFHLLQPAIIKNLNSVIQSKQLSAFIAFTAAEEVIKRSTSSSDDVTSHDFVNVSDIKSSDRDIVAYIAGFILLKCKRKFSNIEKYIDFLTDRDGSTKLIAVKSRGGLLQPSCDFVQFLVMLEIIFRNLSSSSLVQVVPSMQKFLDGVFAENEVVSLFYNCTYFSESDCEVQEKLFLFIISMFHKVRCHSLCKQRMEKFFIHSRTQSKQKALRKSID